ncbi:MAG: HK97 family phage prohead protease [Alphaproteobacteria bacterium]|nr:HK97 family phage prohead protease [Alphaproteobacteria bacterium]
MRNHHRLHAVLEIKTLSEAGAFAGYASVFGVVDSQHDMVMPGAFAFTLEKRAGQIKLLWQHLWDEPIGVLTTIFEDARGLYIEGQLLMEIARAKEAYALLKAGVVKGLSIGYTPGRWKHDPDTGVRHLQSVDLWEISLVTTPANAAAQVTVVKSDAAALIRSGALIKLADALDYSLRVLK